ncbi:hypothetical protein SAMN05660860_01157 [Geoalkalibacter ferrihydriticus]|uniref:Uncharacterized protein n=2 Tax=Geoalkalibacter ferrihydriticus TaxID=392333 RepID=A0A0C2EGE6_9BACT|nr:hypothetical protein [Geoalkalibacter ferrihydriticus]KIH77688.1 hypothetical protein GFER_03215 [Geoalkalibacter ferrihydriticus DSM 17813]SDL73819.1 hypothetical protein SAMN05660860_01157 [Geoalkalibacter ferrihydriticus]
MFFIPLNQLESVELVVHALKMAGGTADCTTCPAHRVCMKQCLSIAAAVEQMIAAGTLPSLDEAAAPPPQAAPATKPEEKKAPGLKVVK